jgi:hypothetical protein
MAIAVVLDFEGGSAETYDAVVGEMGLTGQPASAVAGLIFHAAGPTATGWRVIDAWESEADLERFRQDRLMPAAEKVGGVPRPQVQVTPIHAMQR